LALDSLGQPHLSYWTDGGDDVTHAWRDGSGWHREVVAATSHDLATTAIAIDSNDHPHIAWWFDADDTLRYARFDGTWHHETIHDYSASSGAGFVSLALDSSDTPHIAHQSPSTGELDHYVQDGGWQRTTIGPASGPPMLRLDTANRPHIGYSRTDGPDTAVYYVYFNGSWNPEQVTDGYFSWLVLDTADSPHLSLTRASGGVWHAYR
jgi:hypothetical protein